MMNYVFDIKNERELFYFMNLSFKENYHIDIGRWGAELEGMKKATSACFAEKNKDASCRLISFQMELNNNFLGENSFSFLDDYDACFFAWSYIKHLRENPYKDNQYLMTDWAKTCIKMYVIPDTHIQRLRAVVGYYDCLGISLDRKRELLSTLILKWNEIEVKNKLTRWIDKDNEEMCDWLWNYLLKEKSVCNDICIRNTREKYFAIMGFLNAWGSVPAGPSGRFKNTGNHIEDKETFLIKMHKTWKQKKYREKLKMNELKLSQSTLKKLAFIHQQTKVRPEEYIANYIDGVYKKLI